MRSSGRLAEANNVVAPAQAVDAFFQIPNVQSVLMATHVDWRSGHLLSAPDEVRRLLKAIGGIRDETELTPTGLALLGKLQVDLEEAARTSAIADKFALHECIAKGKNSIAFRAQNKAVNRTVVLKFLRPLRPDDAEESIRRLGALERIPHLVAPIDSFSIETNTVSSDVLPLYCIVFPHIPGSTLQDYLRGRPPLTPAFFDSFIRQVGGVLRSLEAQGLYHGDLHGGNILVSREEPSLDFTVIDPSAGLSAPSLYGRELSDFQWFQEHIATALLLLQRHLPTTSLQKHLGPRLFSAINAMLRANEMVFADVLRLLDANPRYEKWLKDRAEFVANKFKPPKPLGLLRWEEIADPARAVELFEPYPELFARVRAFGNALVVGARGSGKSTYLAALAYFNGAEKRTVEPSEIFGVLFSCRQGEFKQISSDFVRRDVPFRFAVKHVLVLKILRRVLRTLASATELAEFVPSGNVGTLYDFIKVHLDDEVSIPNVDSTPTAALYNLAEGVVRWEEMELGKLFRDRSTFRGEARPRLDEAALLTFCNLVRALFPALSTTQFYFLFDDAGEPNIPAEAQHALNDLVTSSNPVFCIKLSAERFSYDLRDSAGRTIEETHDFTSFDIAAAYAAESGIDDSRAAIKGYFARIMKRRLEHWNYQSSDIADYLGDQLRGDDTIPVRELVRRLADGRKNAYYSGWEVIWQLADKTARNLIELVSEIFARAKVRPPEGGVAAKVTVQPNVIAARIQDKAIRVVSNRRLRGLEFTPGEIVLRGRTVPLGRHLYLCATSFGSVSYKYLAANRGHSGEHRIDERLGIERNDTSALNPDGQTVLRLLVRYGIFDDSTLTVAFDDRQKKPVYVFNRIFCPAFGISFRRDAHLRLSARKFEMYLMDPATFAEQGTGFLRKIGPGRTTAFLWDGGNDD